MKGPQTVSRVLLDPGRRPFDYCRGYMLYASLDGVAWGNPSLVPLAFVSLLLIPFFLLKFWRRDQVQFQGVLAI